MTSTRYLPNGQKFCRPWTARRHAAASLRVQRKRTGPSPRRDLTSQPVGSWSGPSSKTRKSTPGHRSSLGLSYPEGRIALAMASCVVTSITNEGSAGNLCRNHRAAYRSPRLPVSVFLPANPAPPPAGPLPWDSLAGWPVNSVKSGKGRSSTIGPNASRASSMLS